MVLPFHILVQLKDDRQRIRCTGALACSSSQSFRREVRQ